MLHCDRDVLVHDPQPPVKAAEQEQPDSEDLGRSGISGGGRRPATGDRRQATMAPPMKKAAATAHPAMIHRWVGRSIISRPCQSSMIMVGTEIAKTRSADPTMSAQPRERGARMWQQARSATAKPRGSLLSGETAGGGGCRWVRRIRSGPRTATTRD
jgi:hypothetical protein